MDEINRYKERLQIALTAAKICIFEVDLLQQLYTYFENAEVIFGISGEKILKDVQPFSKLEPVEYRKAASAYFSHPEDEAVIEKAFKDILRGKESTYEARMRAGGSGYVWCRIHATPIIENGVPARMVGVIADISDLREQTENLKKAVNMDAFTELFNKEYAIGLISEILRKSKDLNHALLILDIDNFKNYNDTFGHSEGDKVIKAVSRKIHFGKRISWADSEAMNLFFWLGISKTCSGLTASYPILHAFKWEILLALPALASHYSRRMQRDSRNYLQRPMPHCTRRRRKREFSYIIMSNSGNSKEGLFFFLFLFQGNTNHDFLTK